jgi:peptidylprolyl isomerase
VRGGRPGAVSVLAVVLAVGLAACGTDDDEEAPVPDATEQPDLDEKPDPAAALPDDRDDPPAELVQRDLVVGEGEEAVPGDVVHVHYVGVSWSTGDEFDASWDRGQPFTFELGDRQVIEGWDEGVAGMRVGGRRELIIPPHLAYGERGAVGVIAPNETLVFVVDLLEIERE